MKPALIWQTMPAEVRAVVAPLLRSHVYLVPPWCRTIYITYGAPTQGNEGALAEASIEFQYRQATVNICPAFLDENDSVRRKTIAHELIHIAIAPLSDWASSIIERFVPEGNVRTMLMDDLTERTEGTVEDVSAALAK